MTAPIIKKKPIPADSEEKKKLRESGKIYAMKEIQEIFADSAIEDKSGTFPKFHIEELTLGKILGKGGFGTVYEVRGFTAGRASKASGSDDEEVGQGGMESRQFIADHCIRKGGDARYAVKMLSDEIIADPDIFARGIMDMATETRVLSDTEHPNIIKMRACAVESPFDEKYFIVMDRLYDTLEHRMQKWAAKGKRNNSLVGKLLDSSGEKRKNTLEEKLVAAFDLCAAIGYLHNRGILYRDLKPENVGFDIRDDIKVFDFGLAKELKTDMKPDKDGLYRLTGMTGSPRYMAPEVGKEQPYNELCDTYSFAILFWQMYSDKVPFEVYGMKSLREKVWSGELKRPFVQECWPVPIKTLLRRGWSQEIHERPNFSQIYNILRSECVRIRDGNCDGLEHSRRRSTFVFRGARGSRLSSATSAEMKKGSGEFRGTSDSQKVNG